MKSLFKIGLILSLAINAFFLIEEFFMHKGKELEHVKNKLMGGELSNTKWKQGLEIFTQKLRKKDTTLLDKKYYYICTWTNWCKPCIREMPWLDSIAGGLSKDVGYFFVTDLSDELAEKCIKRSKFRIKNFIYLNDLNTFISAVCNEKGTKNKVYPMVLIITNEGVLVHFSIGAYRNASEAAGFADIINKLE